MLMSAVDRLTAALAAHFPQDVRLPKKTPAVAWIVLAKCCIERTWKISGSPLSNLLHSTCLKKPTKAWFQTTNSANLYAKNLCTKDLSAQQTHVHSTSFNNCQTNSHVTAIARCNFPACLPLEKLDFSTATDIGYCNWKEIRQRPGGHDGCSHWGLCCGENWRFGMLGTGCEVVWLKLILWTLVMNTKI